MLILIQIPKTFDILPTPKGGDSLSRRSMSRTEEDIASRVDITIMRDATLRTYPASYSEVCDTFRPRLAFARRTDSGRERFIHFLVPSPVRSRFVAEHASEGRPACIEHRLRHAGLGESGGVYIADRDRACVQGEFLAASRGQPIEIETARPGLIPFQRMLLSVVAEIPDEAAGAVCDPPAMIASGGEVPISVHCQTGSGRDPHPQEWHLLPGSSAGVSVPESR
jgi:hypothetical protein